MKFFLIFVMLMNGFVSANEIYNTASESCGTFLNGTVHKHTTVGGNLFLSDMAKSKFSEQDIIKIYGEYINDNRTMDFICKKYNCRGFYKRFHQLFLPIKNLTSVRFNHNINHDFFNQINSEIKAYLLGFFAADGHIKKNGHCYQLSIGIHKKDIEIINLYNKFICNGTGKIQRVKGWENGRQIIIGSKQIGEDLLKLGYDNRKTYTCKHLPNIPKKFRRHFIRGYFDGDGSVACYNRKLQEKYWHIERHFSICAKNKSILSDILSEFPNLTGGKVYLKKKINKKTKHFCYVLCVYDKINLKIIYKYLYHYSRFFLKRKNEIFKLCLIDYNKKNDLTESDIRQIRKEYIPRKVTLSLLSKKYKVGTDTIYRIIKRETWRHIK